MVTKTCTNPRCVCVPCSCDECRCGTGRLGELERRVMDVVWSAAGSELTGRAIADQLPEYAYTTVVTVLDRLARKGEVRRRLDERVKRYSAVRGAGAHTAQAMRLALDAANDPDDALLRFVQDLPAGQLDVLRNALELKELKDDA